MPELDAVSAKPYPRNIMAAFIAALGGRFRLFQAPGTVKRLEMQLLQIKQRFDLCIRGSEAGIWELDLATGKLFMSEQFRQLLGWTDDKIPDTAENLLTLVHSQDAARVKKKFIDEIADSKSIFDFECRLRGRYGGFHWFHAKAAIRRNDAGKAVCLAGSMSDITARKRAETELRRHHDRLEKMVEAQVQDIKNSEARLTAAMNAISDGFCLLDKDQRIIHINNQMKHLHPEVAKIVAPGAEMHVVGAAMISYAPDEAERLSWAQCLERLKQGVTNDELGRSDGTWLKITRARTESGDTIVLHTDVTRYKQQEAVLQAQAAELEQALVKEKELNNTHRQFVFMASHEFRTPLAIIDGSTQLLCADPANLSAEKVIKRCEKIRNAVSRMTSLIDSTLTAARLDAGKVEVIPAPCDLRALISEVCESHQEITASHHIQCNLAEFPDQIAGDCRALERVMINLLSNAIKYSPPDSDVIVQGWQNAGNAYVSVTDHGVGIAEADLPRMFSRFFRAQTSVGTAGTGLGLSVAQELVKLHGGNISVKSRVGEGSTFTVMLPIAGPAARNEAA